MDNLTKLFFPWIFWRNYFFPWLIWRIFSGQPKKELISSDPHSIASQARNALLSVCSELYTIGCGRRRCKIVCCVLWNSVCTILVDFGLWAGRHLKTVTFPRFLDRVVPPDQNFEHGYCGVFRWQDTAHIDFFSREAIKPAYSSLFMM